MIQTAEFEFVALCACVKPGIERCRKIKLAAADSDLDWKMIYDIALAQKVYPLLYQNLKSIVPGKMPESLFLKLKSIYIKNAVKNILLASVLIRTLNHFEKNSIMAVPFKGPVIAHDFYGNIDLRQFSDLDILVYRSDSPKVWEILIADGFRPEFELSPKQRLKYIKTEDNISFFKNNFSIELHWELSGLYLSKPLTIEKIANRLIKTQIYTTEVFSLSLEYLLVYLCIHGAKHGWESLDQICCVAEVLRGEQTINWSLVEDLALKWRCLRMLYLGLILANSFLGAPVPFSTMDRIYKDREIMDMCGDIRWFMVHKNFQPKVNTVSDRFLFFHMKIRDSLADRLRYGMRLLFCPTGKEWQAFPVPAELSFLHYGLRPLRLIQQGIVKTDA